jgi:hypothetical protein
MKPFLVGIIVVALVGMGGLALTLNKGGGEEVGLDSEKTLAVLYKSPNCGCCGNHAAYLRRNGFDVEVVETDNIGDVKSKNNIPAGEESCHTTVIGDYVVEGHVPVEAIEKLLTEKPAVKGIGLAAMPAGSPGMPGPKQSPFQIYSFTEGGAVDSYMNL